MCSDKIRIKNNNLIVLDAILFTFVNNVADRLASLNFISKLSEKNIYP